MATNKYLRIAVPAPLYCLFDYAIPAHMSPDQLLPGMRIKVPFGRSQKIGVLIDITSSTDIASAKIKPAIECLDQQALLDPMTLQLLRWASDYYHYPVGEVVHTALPGLLRKGYNTDDYQLKIWQLTELGKNTSADLLKRAPKQLQVFNLLAQNPNGISAHEITDIPGWRSAMNALQKKELVHFGNSHTMRDIKSESLPVNKSPTENALALNPQQRIALDKIMSVGNTFHSFLLFGDTGSGKTEIYMQFIESLLQQQKQVLVLVPEIGLTPQLIERFHKRFRQGLAVSHSGLNDTERLQTWLAAKQGQAQVILGTRSAIFTPMLNPGAIIIDEEHDLSFKQQDGFRYSARDIAVRRAHMLDIPVIGGSATPSLESLFNCHTGKYSLLRLTQRAGEAQKPDIQLINIKNKPLQEGLSESLLENMQQHLDKGQQVLIFLNRRGYAPTLMCHDCGWMAKCDRCDARLTWHAGDQRLRCHHCGHERNKITQCSDCQGTELYHYGAGTERIEQVLQQRFDKYSVVRIDRDSTRRKHAMRDKLEQIHSGKHQILIGTQMLAKGHHFSDVTLVGIIEADQGLFGTDFRTSERMSQLILQVAGRAGREQHPGQVLIQTHHSEHPLLQLIIQQDYEQISNYILDERKQLDFPPYSYLALLRSEATQADLPIGFLQKVTAQARQLGIEDAQLFGPMPAPMEKRAGRYRAHLLVISDSRTALHFLLKHLIPIIETMREARKVRWSLDIDPAEML